LTPCQLAGVKEELWCGVYYEAFENRRTRQGPQAAFEDRHSR